ncbi:protein plastid transcriptionally active 16, chloroplastic [Heracleum sosnowskyi]|uniref:Protein plastid transcriptionally active 16, chloroplastic n=1 Tax=Heracleum sosnowskyi TaxID=360622 RepID=A0AAD8H047_9APIA|nr:protein plastid transcriptionally active 16, chloroplastic [Heracleum sosnowskyi]
MAPAALSSNSYILATIPHSRISLTNSKLTALAAKNGGSFRVIKAKAVSEDQESKPAKLNPFQFDFGNLPDVKSLIPVVKNSSGLSFGQRSKDPGTVFVAGATGQAGIRIAQTLLRNGFSVRAGVPDLAAAQELAQLAAKYKIISAEESKRLNAVESTFEDAESIAKAIGNAGKVVVTIGPAENGATTAVTASDALQVIQAADLAGVGHVAITLTIAELIQGLVETDISYTLIKAKLTEDYLLESSYNVVVSAEASGDSTNDYKVTKSQIASLVSDVFSNTEVAENKVVEVYADPTAPLRPVDELFSLIPEDGRRKAYAEKVAKAKVEEATIKANEKAQEAAAAAKKLKEEVKILESQDAQTDNFADKAQEKASASVENLVARAKEMSSTFSWDKFSSQLSTAVQNVSDEPKVQIATVRGQARAQKLPAKKAVVKKPPVSRRKEVQKTKAKQAEPKAEVRNVFGGLFKQETIYVDDD